MSSHHTKTVELVLVLALILYNTITWFEDQTRAGNDAHALVSTNFSPFRHLPLETIRATEFPHEVLLLALVSDMALFVARQPGGCDALGSPIIFRLGRLDDGIYLGWAWAQDCLAGRGRGLNAQGTRLEGAPRRQGQRRRNLPFVVPWWFSLHPLLRSQSGTLSLPPCCVCDARLTRAHHTGPVLVLMLDHRQMKGSRLSGITPFCE